MTELSFINISYPKIKPEEINHIKNCLNSCKEHEHFDSVMNMVENLRLKYKKEKGYYHLFDYLRKLVKDKESAVV